MRSYEVFLAKSDAAILIVSNENKILFVSQSAIRLLKECREILVNKIISLEGGALIYLVPDDLAISQFVVLHQLKAPLAAIKWVAEDFIDDDGSLNPHQTENFRTIYETNKFMINLVNDLLNVKRFQGGAIKVNLASSDIVELIANVIQMLQPSADKKNQKIVLEMKIKPDRVLIDNNLFSIAMENLLENAINYGLKNSTLKIFLDSDASGDYLVSVYNEGLEMNDEDKEKIFTKFYRSEEAKKMRSSGTGLGLFIAKSAIEANRGKIWFHSDDGKTTFYFTVPKVS